MYEARMDCSGSGCSEGGGRQDSGKVAADRVVVKGVVYGGLQLCRLVKGYVRLLTVVGGG